MEHRGGRVKMTPPPAASRRRRRGRRGQDSASTRTTGSSSSRTVAADERRPAAARAAVFCPTTGTLCASENGAGARRRCAPPRSARRRRERAVGLGRGDEGQVLPRPEGGVRSRRRVQCTPACASALYQSSLRKRLGASVSATTMRPNSTKRAGAGSSLPRRRARRS
jgi:hypothetical protein